MDVYHYLARGFTITGCLGLIIGVSPGNRTGQTALFPTPGYCAALRTAAPVAQTGMPAALASVFLDCVAARSGQHCKLRCIPGRGDMLIG